ncbi:MAG TPA: carbamoyltransferase HypF [Gemmatimonadales bacterium]|nr:carbamoyltransferase HypF [Gemmatimonadales bacterium]
MVQLSSAAGAAPHIGLSDREGRAVRVTGVVQGVGFRPFVHRLAVRLQLHGWVLNAAGEVRIEVEGAPCALDAFLAALELEAPPLAQIERVAVRPRVVTGLSGFSIQASEDEPDRRQPVAPDVAVCAACEAELRDPADRRYGYPFITCTDCGPRFTVIESMPYDRARTSMAAFTQCEACQREYDTPGDRRHHSETNSCPACGPRLWYTTPDGVPQTSGSDEALSAAALTLFTGGIVAVRGVGGFQLAVDATNPTAVAELRLRKRREAKPLAVMVRTVEEAGKIGVVGRDEATLLRSPMRPIVLLARGERDPLADGIAPGLAWVGVMLPATPLHDLLLDRVRRPLVMTSGNVSEEPIAIGNEEALARLEGIADGFLLHDREIVARYDDSVVRTTEAGPVLMRRARGYAPLPLDLPVGSPVPFLAVGPHLKNTFTLVHGSRAYVSQHIGDLENLETLEHFNAALARFKTLFRIEPEAVVHDLHPGYFSTRVARESGLRVLEPVQHHHAHAAAVMAEHGRTDPVLALAFDGVGYGSDGGVWGGEVLQADLTGFRRVGHLRPAPLPGGDLAARNPWRAALGYLMLDPHLGPAFTLALDGIQEAERAIAELQATRGVNAPWASSMGRLFDAAAAVLGLRLKADYEGQAAMELESLAGRRVASEIRVGLERSEEGAWVIDPLHLLAVLGSRRQRGDDIADLAADFHASVAWAAAEVIRRVSDECGIRTVTLGGGTFQNARLLTSMVGRLQGFGLTVLWPRRLSPNDGAISFGQAAVAAARLAC